MILLHRWYAIPLSLEVQFMENAALHGCSVIFAIEHKGQLHVFTGYYEIFGRA